MLSSLLNRRNTLSLLAAACTAFTLPAGAQDAPKRGGTLVVGSTQVPRHLNGGVQSGVATAMPSTQIFASPLRFDDKWNAQPYLAESWKLADDGKSLTLNLRKNAVFHDGKPVTSADVAFSIMAIKANHPFQTMLGPVEKVDTPDPYTAIIRMSVPHPAIVLAMSPALCPILPKHIYGDGQDLKNHPRNSADVVGSGPFRVTEFKPSQRIVMERFDKFFLKDLPRLDRIIIKEYKDPASLMLALERGEIDLHPGIGDPRDLARAKQMPGMQLVGGAQPAVGPLLWLAFNTKSPKLADKRVRQAISYAIDRQFIAQQLFAGVHKLATGPIASGSPFYSAEVEKYAFNLAKANQLLDAAGLKPGANGMRLALELDSIPGSNELKVMQEYMKPALAKVGIDITVRLSPDFPTWARRVSGHQFEVTMDSVWNWGDPVIGVHRTWLSSNIKPGVIWSNTQSYSNAQADSLMAAAGQEMNMAKRKALYKDLQKIVVDDCPVAFLLEPTVTEAYTAKVANPPRGIWGLLDSMVELSMRKA